MYDSVCVCVSSEVYPDQSCARRCYQPDVPSIPLLRYIPQEGIISAHSHKVYDNVHHLNLAVCVCVCNRSSVPQVCGGGKYSDSSMTIQYSTIRDSDKVQCVVSEITPAGSLSSL